MSAGRLNGPGVHQCLAGSGVRGRSLSRRLGKCWCGHHSAYPVRVTPASRDIKSSLSHSPRKESGSWARSGTACAGTLGLCQLRPEGSFENWRIGPEALSAETDRVTNTMVDQV